MIVLIWVLKVEIDINGKANLTSIYLIRNLAIQPVR